MRAHTESPWRIPTLVNQVLFPEETPQMENLPRPKTNKRHKREKREILHPEVGRFYTEKRGKASVYVDSYPGVTAPLQKPATKV